MKSVLIALLLLLAGCSSNISNRIALPFIPTPEGLSDKGKGAMVFIEEVKDMRGDAAIGQTSSGPIEAMGSAPASVRDSLDDIFKKSGFNVTDSAPIVLQVQLRKWFADVKKGIPLEINSEAELFLQVFDPGNNLAYSGSYQGTSQLSGSGLDDRAVKEALATAMTQAIGRIGHDQQLLKLLSSF